MWVEDLVEKHWKSQKEVNGKKNVNRVTFFFFLPWLNSSSGPRLPLCRRFMITRRHTTLARTPGRKISSSQRPIPDNTQHSQETDTYAPTGIRTHNPNKQAAADPRLRPRGHWNPSSATIATTNLKRTGLRSHSGLRGEKPAAMARVLQSTITVCTCEVTEVEWHCHQLSLVVKWPVICTYWHNVPLVLT